MKKFFGFARRKSSSSLKGLNPRRFSIGSSASSTTLQIQVVRGGYNVDLGKVDSSFTKLHKAALLNDEQKVRKQIKNVDVNARDSSDRTPLHLATVNGNLKIIRTLIEAGANVNAQDSDGKTPIVKSIECNHEELVQFFLFAGADAELADYETGNTPLHWALSNGSVKAAQYLLRNAKKLDVNITNNQKETSLHLAVKLPQLCIILEELIANGAHIDAKDDRGKTPLVTATANENTSAVATLLKYGSNAYSSDDDRHHTNNNNHINSINSVNSVNNYKIRKDIDISELDNDSWPETDEEDSNYEQPLKESNKPRIGSFKRDSLNRVSSLVDETIVEELKSEETADTDDDTICKPSTSHKNININHSSNANTTTNKLVWKESSSSDDDTNKLSVNGSLGKSNAIKSLEQMWTSNDTVKEVVNINHNGMDDPFNVMDELETLLLDNVSDNKNADFISEINDLLEEPKPKVNNNLNFPPSTIDFIDAKPSEGLEKPIIDSKLYNKPEFKINQSIDLELTATEVVFFEPLKELPKPLIVNTTEILKEELDEGIKRKSYAEMTTSPHFLETNPVEEIRRRSYAEVVAQPKVKQAVIDELKANISKRAKSYADVDSSSKISDVKSMKDISSSLTNNSNILPNNQNNKQLNTECNNILHSNNKKNSKIPLPVKQSSFNDHTVQRIDTDITTSTSDESIASKGVEEKDKSPVKRIEDNEKEKSPIRRIEDNEKEKSPIRRIEDNEKEKSPIRRIKPKKVLKSTNSSPVKMNKSHQQNGTVININEFQQQLTQLRIELEKEKNERAILAAENDIIKDQMMHLTKRTQDDNFAKFDLEKRLIKLEAELNQCKFENEMKCKENVAFKSELEQTIHKYEKIQKQNKILESDRQRLTNQNDLLANERESITKQLSERSNSVPIVNIDDINTEWREKLDERQEENLNLKNECDRYRRIISEKELQYEREKFEWQKSVLQMDADMKRMQCELEVKTLKSTPEEQLELIKAVRDLNLLMVKLDDRISRNEELQQQKAKSLNEEMFECARNLLDQMRHELTNFKQILANSVNLDEFKNEENQEKQLSAYELRIAEIRSSLERLEDQIQSQELQLIRQSDIISLASTPLRKSSSSRELFISNSKPKSWFVQTLIRLQSHIQSNTPTGDTITQFAHQKKNLQKQIHDLKSELGLFEESVH